MVKYGVEVDEKLLAEHYILDHYWINISNRVQDGLLTAEEAVNVMDLMILPIVQRNVNRLKKTMQFPEFDALVKDTERELDSERAAMLEY